MKTQSPINSKSVLYGEKIVELFEYLSKENREFVISKQILRSGTSIGANVSEAKYAQSRKDFIHKLSIALKEANESLYWLGLLLKGNHIDADLFSELKSLNIEIIKILTAIINTSKDKDASNKQ
jgi:four helix bundle protein